MSGENSLGTEEGQGAAEQWSVRDGSAEEIVSLSKDELSIRFAGLLDANGVGIDPQWHEAI